MSSHQIFFAKVLFVIAVIRYSDGTSSPIINATPTTSLHSSLDSTTSRSTNAENSTLGVNATPTTYIPGSTTGGGGSSGGNNGGGNNDNNSGSPNGGNSSTSTGGPMTTTEPPTTTPKPTTVPTTPHPCESAKKPTKFDQCDETCAQKYLSDMELFINCGKTGSEIYDEHPTKLPDLGEELALMISADIKNKLQTNQPVNTTTVIVTDQLAVGASILNSAGYTNISRGMFYFPNISINGVKEKLGSRSSNSIQYPKNELPIRSGIVQVTWSISEPKKTVVPEEEIEPYRDIVWRLPIGDMKIFKNKIVVGKEKPNLAINSPIITFTLVPAPSGQLQTPLQITFKRLKNTDVRNHRCYFWSTTTGYWSSVGASVVQNDDTHTVCSYNHMSTFVVLSEVYNEGDEDARKIVRIVAIVFCVLAMAALVATIRMTRKLQCFDNDRVNIHVHLCVVLLIGYFLFIIGTVKNDIKILNDILSVGLHFCQLSPFVWLALEAVYFVNTMYPLFNYENTNTQKMYISLGWALTAAFAGATAGYDRPHNGKPLASEIVWVFIDKSAVHGYFFGPLLLLFIINICVRVGLVIFVFVFPPKHKDDKASLRIKVNLLTTLVLTAVLFLAWFFGVKAVNNTETKGYHYGFILLYCFQAFLVFIIYGWQNEEMWSLHNKRKEEEKKMEERKIAFTYVP